MAANWWDAFPITQRFGASEPGYGSGTETGTDYGTPLHTVITSPFAGVVQSAGYFPWGGEVDVAVAVPGQPKIKDQTVIHLDQISVKPGQKVTAGSVLGVSGGQLSGGAHPVSSAYSSGPHTELDFFSGKPFASTSYDPTQILEGVGAGGVSFPNPLQPVSDVAGAISGIPTTIGHGLADAVGAGVTDVGVWFRRQAVAFFVAAVVLYVLFAGTGKS